MNLDFFIKQVDENEFNKAAKRALEYAKNWEIESRKAKLPDETDQQDYDIITDITQYILDSDIDPKEQIILFFELYNICPSFSLLSTLKCFYWENLFESAKKEFWKNVISIFNSNKEYLIKPIEYSLWCDFFEDTRTVKETWNNLVSKDVSDSVLKIVLNVSGPVPFNLKKPLYYRLIGSNYWHIHIFKSLL